MSDNYKNIEVIAKAFHAAWGHHAPLDALSKSTRLRYRKAAVALVKELAKDGFSISNGDPSVMPDC